MYNTRLFTQSLAEADSAGCGEVVARCPSVWAIEVSTWLLRRVGMRLVLVAGGGYSGWRAARSRRAA